ncbi:GAF domain-containing protein [Metabacillus fastidiosus]|uniref:GAF domain-containing protein n=1 Tax=Metabacillus fastidiosus TaxID=1458 RepID=UPI002E1CB234|nr:GAF domain-containing protein [Metabacillus fastidiosus]
MFNVENYTGDKQNNYDSAIKQLKALLDGIEDRIANLANTAAFLNHFLDDINWVGFYLFKDNQLILGPFQGLPACVEIPLNKGVCGTAAANKETLRIANVHEFPGHIACDAASNSEIVIPIVKEKQLIGVLDIDSPVFDRFDKMDEENLEKIVQLLTLYL